MNTDIEYLVKVARRRWAVLAVVLLIGLASIPVAIAYIPRYKATAKLLLVSQTFKDTTSAEPDLPSIATSTQVLERVINRLKLDTNPYTLNKSIKTMLPARSSTLELSFTDRNPDRAALIANTIANESCTYYREVVTRGYSDAMRNLNARIAESRSKIANANERLQRASAKDVFASSDKAFDDLIAQVERLRAQRGLLVSSLAGDLATGAALNGQLQRIQPLVRGEILQKDVVYREFQADFAKDDADLKSELASFRKSFPGLSALARRIARERSELKAAEANAVQHGAGLSASSTQTILDKERAEGVVAADRERLRSIDAQVASEQKHLQRIALASAALSTMRAQRDAAFQQYTTLAQRLSATQGDAAQAASLGTLVVISSAFAGPSEIGRFAPAIAALALAIAIAAAYAAEMYDARFWTAREVQQVYRRPVLFDFGKSR